MFPNDFFIFLQIILFLFITPGPPRVVIVSHTLNYGIKKSVWTAFGDISANLCQGILVVFFIGTFLSDNPNILQALKWAGILYIIYLAYDTYTSRIKLINSDKDASRTRASEIFRYFSSNLSKKKDSNKADAILIANFYHETYKIEE